MTATTNSPGVALTGTEVTMQAGIANFSSLIFVSCNSAMPHMAAFTFTAGAQGAKKVTGKSIVAKGVTLTHRSVSPPQTAVFHPTTSA